MKVPVGECDGTAGHDMLMMLMKIIFQARACKMAPHDHAEMGR
jgi:hypothetical protein